MKSLAALAALALVGVTAATTAGAHGPPAAAHGKPMNSASDRAGCAASPLRSRSVSNARRLSARPSAIHSYDDFIEDVAGAPDICAQNVVTNDNVAIIIGLHVHDRSGFSTGDGYSVYLDTDSDATTGTGQGLNVPVGSEYVVELASRTSSLGRWNGTAFDPVAVQEPLVTGWLEGYGPLVQVARTDLGD